MVRETWEGGEEGGSSTRGSCAVEGPADPQWTPCCLSWAGTPFSLLVPVGGDDAGALGWVGGVLGWAGGVLGWAGGALEMEGGC